MILYTTGLFALGFLFFMKKRLILNGPFDKVLPALFTLKVLCGFLFLYVYSEIYGQGELGGDAGVFFNESKKLNDLFFHSPLNYLKSLVGIQNETISSFTNTMPHWSSGKQAILNENRNLIRVHSIIHFFSFNQPIIHVFVSSFVSVFSTIYIFRAIESYTKVKSVVILLIVSLAPSFLFWSSGILKEPFALLGFSLLLYSLFNIDFSIKKITLLIIGSCLLIGFKLYLFFAFIPLILFIGIYRFLPRKKLLGSLVILLLIPIVFSSFFPVARQKLIHRIGMKQYDFTNLAKGGIFVAGGKYMYYFEPNQYHSLRFTNFKNDSLWPIDGSKTGEYIQITKQTDVSVVNYGGLTPPSIDCLSPGETYHIIYFAEESEGYISLPLIRDSFWQLIKNIPQAISNTLFRPFFGDEGSSLKYPAILETILLFSLLIIAFIKKRKLSENETKIIFSLLIFTFSLAIIIGLTTPVLGAIVRYRIPVYTAISLIALIIIKPFKIVSNE